MSHSNFPSIDIVRQSLRYEDGKLFWKERPQEHFPSINSWGTWNTRYAGNEAGSVGKDGRCELTVSGFKGHRYTIVWVLIRGEWPSQIDHENRDCLDDRFENLRIATHSQNLANARRRSDNTSGYKGVSWSKKKNKWESRIEVNGKTKFLGYFDDPVLAHAAYMEAARRYFGEFAFDGNTSKIEE